LDADHPEKGVLLARLFTLTIPETLLATADEMIQ